MQKQFTEKSVARFWDKVNKDGQTHPVCGPCWLWTAGKDKDGYGRVRICGTDWAAHRLSWRMANGPIPPGMCVLHTCDAPSCVNPAHLFIGTNVDNMADKTAKGREARGDHNGAAKLTATKVAAIREIYAAGGRSQRSLAREFGVGHVTISYITRGETWKTAGEMGGKFA